MSQHRGRNIFTLGDFHLKKQRSISESKKRPSTSDPFERDPFKIQSYNFRYAERPIYPVRPTQRQQEQPQSKQFNTFYYNQDFSPVANNATASRRNTFGNNGSSQGSHSKYQEHRRRKFVQNSGIRSAGQNPLLGTLSPYPMSLNSSSNFQFQNNRQPVSSSSFLRHSYADSYLEPNTAQNAAPYLGNQCQRNSLSTNSERNGSSLLRSSLTKSYLDKRNSPTGTWFTDRCNGTASSVDSANRSSCNILPTLSGSASGNSSTKYIGNTNQNTSVSSMRPNISQSSFMELPKRRAHQPTTSPVYSNSRIISEKPIIPSPPSHFHSSLPPDTRTHQSLVSASRSSCSKRKRNSSSGCEININIKNLEDNSISDNLTIKIARDPIEQNLDVPPTKKLNLTQNFTPYSITPNAKFNINTSSSTSFVIDKRLSKFAVNRQGIEISPPNAKRLSTLSVKNTNFSRSTTDAYNSQAGRAFENPLENNLRERTKTLSSIYAPQTQSLATRKSSIPRAVLSTERMPSMVPWRDNLQISRKSTSETIKTSKVSKDPKSKDSLPYSLTNLGGTSKSCRISNISHTTTNSNANKVNNYMKSTISNISLKHIILQKFHSSKRSRLRIQPLQLNYTRTALPSVNEKRCHSKHSEKLYCSRTKRLNWSKLPLKININVFAEKVKLL